MRLGDVVTKERRTCLAQGPWRRLPKEDRELLSMLLVMGSEEGGREHWLFRHTGPSWMLWGPQESRREADRVSSWLHQVHNGAQPRTCPIDAQDPRWVLVGTAMEGGPRGQVVLGQTRAGSNIRTLLSRGPGDKGRHLGWGRAGGFLWFSLMNPE